MSYIPFRRSVTKEFRDLLLRRYPALAGGPSAEMLRQLAQYILFARFDPAEDDWSGAESRLVIPATALAAMADRNVDGHGFNAARVLQEFSQTVWPLDMHEHRYVEGRARTISQVVPPEIGEAFAIDQRDWTWDTNYRVWFVSGKPLTRNTFNRARLSYEVGLLAAAAKTPNDHPARSLMNYLNAQPQIALGKLLRRNWPRVVQLFDAMPGVTERDRRRREHVARVMAAIRDFDSIIYKGSERTTRIFAQGLTINQLPRAMRQVALQGALHCDIRSCQLAVAASLWDLPKMQTFLASQPPRSIWHELATHLRVGEGYKDTLKRALYAVLFGAKPRTIGRILNCGDLDVPGLPSVDSARRFRSHYLIRELFDQRDQQIQAIADRRAITDAFGREIPLGSRDPRSLLAEQIQSYEMKMIIALLPTFQADRRLVLLNHLHDGFSLYSSRPGDYSVLGSRLQKVFAQAAADENISTTLEITT